MAKTIEELRSQWQQRLINKCPDRTDRDRESILDWLLGEYPQQGATSTQQLAIFNRNIDCRFGILYHRYLERSQTHAYKNLMCCAIDLLAIRALVENQIPFSRDRQRSILDTAEKVVLDMVRRDRYIQRQIQYIARCTDRSQLRDSLLFASLEEYWRLLDRSPAAIAIDLHPSASLPTNYRYILSI